MGLFIVNIHGDIEGDYDIIRQIPSADVRENIHGEWIKTISENGITSAVRCSECGFEDNRYMLFNYCPNCGADMRGGD